jgi:hypothetical protein
MARYAEGTTVSVEKSQAEIQALIRRYGARRFASGYDEDSGTAVIQFEIHGLRVMFRLQLPDSTDDQFRLDGRGRARTQAAWESAYEQECRRMWRSLVMVIKAKLESVESGIETFEEAFLPQIVVPGSGGQTFGQMAVPQIAESYRTGDLPPLLGLPSGKPVA